MDNRIIKDDRDFNIANGILIKYKGTDAEPMIPEGVTKIADYAFMGIV